MPTYGYRCTACSTEFDLWQSMRDEARADCPACGSAARRLIFPAGIVFKGSGFYKTDSRSSTAGTASAPSTATEKAAAGASGSSNGAAGGAGSSGTSGGSGSGSSSSTSPPTTSTAPAPGAG